MIPIGYMSIRVEARPDWLKTKKVVDIYSASGCVSKYFAEYINFWKHNGYWLFNSPDTIEGLACAQSSNLDGTTLFYYEAYEQQYDLEKKEWGPFFPESSFATDVSVPVNKQLEGYDVVSFSQGNAPECSPLSCNNLAETVSVNKHCLLETLEEAKKHLEDGAFNLCEPGPYRIYAVYSVVKF